MTDHINHDMHENSRESFKNHNKEKRTDIILNVFRSSPTPLTDRQVMRRLFQVDPNYVRPAIHDLLEKGVLIYTGDTKCEETKETVRLSALATSGHTAAPEKPKCSHYRDFFILFRLYRNERTRTNNEEKFKTLLKFLDENTPLV